MCVNALNGLTSISTANELECPITAEECQCPQRAYFHFYEREEKMNKKMKKSVNALNGLTSISTVASRNP